MSRRARGAAAAVVATVLLTGCASSASSSGGGSGHAVTRAQFGADWPLTVDNGSVSCDPSAGEPRLYFTAPDGTTYGINGTALDAGAPDIQPIWRDSKLIPGAKMPITPLSDAARKLC